MFIYDHITVRFVSFQSVCKQHWRMLNRIHLTGWRVVQSHFPFESSILCSRIGGQQLFHGSWRCIVMSGEGKDCQVHPQAG